MNTHDDAVPEPWASAFRRAGFVSPVTNEPSLRALQRDTGLHPSTVGRIIRGETRRPQITTVRTLAQVLDEDVATITKWVREALPFEPQRWSPPEEAKLLTKAQRKSLNDMIKSMAEANIVSGAMSYNGIEYDPRVC
ncbi:helix-turn-helix domain-containing protein [Corynebacterium belfantii]|uniref:helix-turn-helix domain-containing protein n=1 Tax=Corynebacterium belfantii TaxID=2014537 RepID=UPI0018D4AAB9|nr:helix-turn-helix transcriptional regulator [Corynebacterium belfantii]MBG9259414.1 helix-turn-helix transcriptional regulator [Corynebacterium belfantii]MBG9266162.1 helix-turn-helix transcriptional regulator [Corynebacterium belfantii]